MSLSGAGGNTLVFADDLVLLASIGQGLQRLLDRFFAECDQSGMKSALKNKYLSF